MPKTKEVEQRCFSTGQSARYLGISKAAFRKMVHDSLIQNVSFLEGVWRFDKADLDELIEKKKKYI
jgi:excisionase family DNA binding protein